jgi:ligand-binding sensor domain-containing protein
LWLGTSKGLSIIEIKPGNSLKVTKNLSKGKGLPFNHIYRLFKDSSGNIWIGFVDGGLGLYNVKTKVIRYFTEKEGLNGYQVVSINEDKNHKIWVATLDGGLSSFDYSSGKIKAYGKPEGLNSSSVWTIFRDSKQDIWFGTHDNGLVKLNYVNYTFTHIPSDKKMNSKSLGSISEDSKGNLWIASIGDGALKFDGKKFTSYQISLGFKSNNPYFIYCDKNDILWLGTNTGIDRFDPVSLNVTNFGKEDGFVGLETNQNAIYSSNEVIWVGTIKGLLKFTPKEIKVNKHPPVISITKARLSLQDSILKENTTLSYNKNNVDFDFAGITLSNAEYLKFQYKLDGFNEEWSPLTTANFVSFHNLPPGKFTFLVKARNNYGYWSKPAAFSFTINPPFWKTIWFILASVISLSVMTYLIYKRRERSVREEERRKSALDLEISELKMEALRAQMNPHFLFNSLNSIQYFITLNDKQSATTYLSKFSKLIRSILDNSMNSNVLLSEEILMLENYIELERLRLENKFSFEIKVGDGISPERIEVPSMLIQPFVENAIVHGLRYRKADGLLKIEFKKNDSQLKVTISDNGIGRAKAEELKKKKATAHKSAGIDVTQKRIDILTNNNYGKNKAKIITTDLYDGEEASGTKVEINIPIVYY